MGFCDDPDLELLLFLNNREAKRREKLGLAPKKQKEEEKTVSPNLFIKNPRLPYIFIALGVIYLIYDLIKYYNR